MRLIPAIVAIIIGYITWDYLSREREESARRIEEQIRATDIKSSKYNTTEGKEALATIINLNGYLCANVVELSGSVHAPIVTCIEYRNGTKRVGYVIDMSSGHVMRI